MTMKTFMRTIMTLAVLLISLENSFAAWPNGAWPDGDGHGKLNGHEYVDLGLSVMWATCNVGAELPSDYGDHYKWGETAPITKEWQKGQTMGLELEDISGTSRDIARVKWGKPWRMPTEGELQELVDLCSWCWTKVNGHKGYKVTGPSGNSIFLPADAHGLTPEYDDFGCIWSSTPYKEPYEDKRHDSAYDLCFMKPPRVSIPYEYSFDDLVGVGFSSTLPGWNELTVSPTYRDIAKCIRPVTDR